MPGEGVRFRDRFDAGHALVPLLQAYRANTDAIVMALPRGGVPVAYVIAQELDLPLELFLVRKLGVPGSEELAMGAIASGGVRILNESVIGSFGIPDAVIYRVAEREAEELARRERAYRGRHASVAAAGKTAILVDDGLATGSSMRAAVRAVRAQGPARIVVAVPVGAQETCAALAQEADQVVCASTPPDFSAVSQWYEHFEQTSDDEVQELYEKGARRREIAAALAGTQEGSNMATREIPRESWRSFFDSLTRQHEGGETVTLEIMDDAIGNQTEANRLLFLGISADLRPDGDLISVMMSSRDGDHVTRLIQHPKRVWVEDNEAGAGRAVQIEAADGVRTLLRLEGATRESLTR